MSSRASTPRRTPRATHPPPLDPRPHGFTYAEVERLPPELLTYAILGLLRSHPKPLAFDGVVRRLGLSTVAERNAVRAVLDALHADGLIGRDGWSGDWHRAKRPRR